MSSNPSDPRESRPTEASLSELAESALRKVVTAIVFSGGIVALAIYARPAPPRYQAIMDEGRIVRIDTRTGTILACEENRCMRVVQRGQRLVRSLGDAPKQDAPPPAALPAPQPQAAPAAK